MAEKDGSYSIRYAANCIAVLDSVPAENVCTSGTMSCSPDPIRFTAINFWEGKQTCSPPKGDGKCQGQNVIACCS